MKWIILFCCWSLLLPNPIEEKIIGEYEGGMPYTIWVTLKLKENGRYEYDFSTHQSVYIKDKGKWELKNDQLILNSSKKIKKRIRGEKVGPSKFLFKNFKFDIEKEVLKYRKKNQFTFKETYFNLVKRKK